MEHRRRPLPSRFSRVYNTIGFTKRYNFILWLIFCGGFMGFALSRSPYLNVYGVFCSSDSKQDLHAFPGECWYYIGNVVDRVGIFLHLLGIIPGAILACFQFVPVIRHRALIFHRINGYIVLVLALTGTVGAFMITRHVFGGGIDNQMVMGLLGFMFLGSLGMAFVNIKRIQIEQHRAWMLRAWFYAASIITLRIIMVILTFATSKSSYITSRPCGQIDNAFDGNRTAVLDAYPGCESYYSGTNTERWVMVQANMRGNTAEKSASLGMNYGTAGWLALFIHAVGIEIYLRLTPAEHERLRNVSYQRQAEAGMRNPGSAGLTVDRFGDSAKWVPAGE